MRASEIKVGRNDVCPCGSGNKYKRCCLSMGQPFSQEKRVRTQDVIQNSLHHLRHRVQSNMGKQFIVHEGELPIKMSEVILELADELLEMAETKSEYKKVIDITCIAWNLTILSEREKQNLLETLFNKVDDEAQQDIRDVLSSLMEKKNRLYPHINRLILDYDFVRNKQNFHLNVVSVLPKEEIAELD